MLRPYGVIFLLTLMALASSAHAYGDPQQVIERSSERQRESDLQRNYESREQTEQMKTQIQDNARLNREIETQRDIQSSTQKSLDVNQPDSATNVR